MDDALLVQCVESDPVTSQRSPRMGEGSEEMGRNGELWEELREWPAVTVEKAELNLNANRTTG